MFGAIWPPEYQGSLRMGRGGRVLPPNGRSSSSPLKLPRKSTDGLLVDRRLSNASSTCGDESHEAGRRRGIGRLPGVPRSVKNPLVYSGEPCESEG